MTDPDHDLEQALRALRPRPPGPVHSFPTRRSGDDHATSRDGRSEFRGEAGGDGRAGRVRTQGAEGLFEVVVGISHGCGR